MITYVDAEAKSRRTAGVIPLHGEAGFAGMRKAGRVAAEVLDILVDVIKPGVTTLEIDKLVYDFGRDNTALPADLFYKGFRHSVCTSLNHVVCHGIPDDRPLREGEAQPALRLDRRKQLQALIGLIVGHLRRSPREPL